MNSVVFRDVQPTQDVEISVRVAGPGPGVDGIFHLMDTNDPNNPSEFEPRNQEGATASWTIPVSHLAQVQHGLDHMALFVRNISFFSGDVKIFVAAKQGGAFLRNTLDGQAHEVEIGTLKNGESDSYGVGLADL